MQQSETPISELMARDPLHLTNTDLDKIIAHLREQRHRFVVAGDKKIGTPEPRKSAAQKSKESRASLLDSTDIQDLFAGL